MRGLRDLKRVSEKIKLKFLKNMGLIQPKKKEKLKEKKLPMLKYCREKSRELKEKNKEIEKDKSRKMQNKKPKRKKNKREKKKEGKRNNNKRRRKQKKLP